MRGSVVAVLATILLASFVGSAAAAGQQLTPKEFATGKVARSGKAARPFDWSLPARRWSSSSRALPVALLRRGPQARITRGQFLAGLLRVEKLRPLEWGEERRGLRQLRPGRALPDAPAGSVKARAIANGWMTARGGRFDANAPITANEAALAMTGVLGIRSSAVSLTLRLRSEVPGARLTIYNAAHALNRTLGLRYNVEDPWDEYELQPNDAVTVAHGAYMLHVAATDVSSWKLDEATQLATEFELPALGPNQAKVLSTAVRQLGQPYIWAGETEGSQAEGKGGFDCSGFTIRVINDGGVAPSALSRINERTTYTQSAIPARKRITRARLQPGDAMFFGERGPRSRPAQNYHAGVYMGNGWFIHSSGGNGGVAIDTLDGWWGGEYAWGRRALRSR